MTVNRGCSEEALSIKNILDQYSNPTELECPKGTPCYGIHLPTAGGPCLDEVMCDDQACVLLDMIVVWKTEEKDLKKCVEEWMEPASYIALTASLTNLTTFNLCNLHIH